MAASNSNMQPWDAPAVVAIRRRWQRLRADGLTAARLIAFHSAHKYLLMAHSVPAYHRLGRLLGDLSVTDLGTLADTYAEDLFGALSRPATRAGHANALQHVAGHFRRQPLSGAQRQQLQAAIAGYRAGQLPLSVPLTVLERLLSAFPDQYLAQQVYLAPSAIDECARGADQGCHRPADRRTGADAVPVAVPVALPVALSGAGP